MAMRGVLHIRQISEAGALPSDGLMSNPGYSLRGGAYSSVDMQLLYSTTPADWASLILSCWNMMRIKNYYSFTAIFWFQK